MIPEIIDYENEKIIYVKFSKIDKKDYIAAVNDVFKYNL